MSSTTLEIIQGLSQAAANAYDGGHDERFTLDGQVRKVGLKREEGCPIMDSRVNDGFSVKFYGNKICINYQSDIRLRDVHQSKDFEGDMVAKSCNKSSSAVHFDRTTCWFWASMLPSQIWKVLVKNVSFLLTASLDQSLWNFIGKDCFIMLAIMCIVLCPTFVSLCFDSSTHHLLF